MTKELRSLTFPRSEGLFTVLVVALGLALFAGAAQTATALNSQEQQIANAMVSASGQRRPFMALDPILAGVARARAQDMAQRNYFAHVNPDGHAANYLVREAGYPLPAWWGTNPEDNFVESIAAGYATPGDVWSGWMASSDHKTHILGENDFYASETSYGVGYYYDAGSPYRYYWVIITAPPAPAPKLAIKSPGTGEQVTEPSVAINGTTSGANVAQVVYRVENSAGNSGFQAASGLAQWSAVAGNLEPGQNTIRVRSLNGSGGTIAEVSRTITYVVLGSLNVAVSGSGSVTNGFAGSTSRPVGKEFSISAEAAPGYLFAGWSGDLASANASLSFTMADGLSLQANFVKNEFAPVRGSYVGALSSGPVGGYFKLALSRKGSFTGRVVIDGRGYSFAGRFDLNGSAVVNIPQGDTTLSLQLNLGDSVGEVTGTVAGPNFTAQLTASRAAFNGNNPVPQAGRYTMVLVPAANPNGAALPPGCGYATLTVAANGTVAVTGRLADNAPFAHGSVLTEEGDLPFFAKSGDDFVAGRVTFRPTSVSDLDGAFTWRKAPGESSTLYPAGFTTQLPVVGSRYVPAAPRTRVLNFTNQGRGTASLGDGNFNQPVSIPVTLTESNTVEMVDSGAPNLGLRIVRETGKVAGSFTHPAAGARKVRGVVLQKQNRAFGYFLGIDEGGDFSLAAD